MFMSDVIIARFLANSEIILPGIIFFEKRDFPDERYVLPVVVVEHENSTNTDKVAYCLWKILCIRSPVKVLICYQRNKEDIALLRQKLEDVIWKESLMTGSNSDLLIIIGDESIFEDSEWRDYFNFFEWRNDSLTEIKSLA